LGQWYYANDGSDTGPIEKEDFVALVRAGTVGPDTLVWTNTLENWEPAHRHVEGVAALHPDLPVQPAMAETHAGQGARDYRRQSGLGDAFKHFFNRYVQFSGRSNRGEFWFWQLDNILISLALGVIDAVIFGTNSAGILGGLWALATFIPSLALSARRLHDIDKSGWWLLLFIIPIVGWIILLVWYCLEPDPESNRFG
jgi:uncharacterized membrane protein YhaH (DUF805 family)